MIVEICMPFFLPCIPLHNVSFFFVYFSYCKRQHVMMCCGNELNRCIKADRHGKRKKRIRHFFLPVKVQARSASLPLKRSNLIQIKNMYLNRKLQFKYKSLAGKCRSNDITRKLLAQCIHLSIEPCGKKKLQE